MYVGAGNGGCENGGFVTGGVSVAIDEADGVAMAEAASRSPHDVRTAAQTARRIAERTCRFSCLIARTARDRLSP
ncbi:MAG TPA: hypothetical protein VJQ09_04055 [Candidatus Limnocylindria bacterium]|nr:hypothetical protein [Candidatus Limnocylindria bacterium]